MSKVWFITGSSRGLGQAHAAVATAIQAFGHRQADGHQQGDPHRAADVLVRVAALEEPLLRLLLGSDAVHLAEQASRARAQVVEEWAVVSRSTDYDASPDFANTPIANLLDPKMH